MAFPPTRPAYEALVNEVKVLKEEIRNLRNEKKEANTLTVDVGLESEPRDRKASQNSWMEIYHNNTVRRKSVKLLGQEVLLDKNLELRLKLGQRGAGISAIFGVAFYIAGGITRNLWLGVIAILFAFITGICFGTLYYKNISFMVLRRLLKETNVVVILVLSICNFIIEIIAGQTQISPVMGFVYMILAFIFVLFDVMKVKSRIFVVVVMATFLAINIFNIYGNTFGDSNHNIILFEYNIQGNQYAFMKRSTQRSIFVQIVLFCMNGMYTMIKDKKMELMIFATGNIYRETGTASKDVEDKTFSMKSSTDKARV